MLEHYEQVCVLSMRASFLTNSAPSAAFGNECVPRFPSYLLGCVNELNGTDGRVEIIANSYHTIVLDCRTHPPHGHTVLPVDDWSYTAAIR